MTSVGIAVVVDVTLVFVLNDIQFPELVVAVVVLNDGIRIDVDVVFAIISIFVVVVVDLNGVATVLVAR